MTALTLAAKLGLYAEPHGDGGCWRLMSPNGVPLYIVEPRSVVGGGVSWRARPVLDLAGIEHAKIGHVREVVA